ncbi:hypothetical protein C8J57DRAFT_1276055 [Mycena rebaudengoi]|nr:hypothetical protein C8J57DRAFT_1276055 [Mycena rebaudengoi]
MAAFGNTVGATLMGILVNLFLLTGVLLSQFSTYWNSSAYKDPLWIRLGVIFLFTLNVVHQGAVMYMAWFYCVENFNNPVAVQHSLWAYPFTALNIAVLAIMNQAFQSWRIWVFIQNRLVVGGLLLTALAVFITGAVAGAQSWILSDLRKLAALQPLVEANLALQAALDILISGILTYCFSKSKTSLGSTDMVLNRLIRGAIESGVFTSVCALGELLSFRFAAGTYIIGLFALPFPRIYTHTIMDHLIRRQGLRNMLGNRGTNKGNIISVPAFDVSGRGGATTTTEIAMSDREERDCNGEGPKSLDNKMV